MSLLSHPAEFLPCMVSQYFSIDLTEYLDYPVLGLQACPLCWRVLVHSPDVLTRPRPLAVQVEAISVGPPLDHAETWPQFSARLLEEAKGESEQYINTLYVTCINRQNTSS